jgi:hypothetical protein
MKEALTEGFERLALCFTDRGRRQECGKEE